MNISALAWGYIGYFIFLLILIGPLVIIEIRQRRALRKTLNEFSNCSFIYTGYQSGTVSFNISDCYTCGTCGTVWPGHFITNITGDLTEPEKPAKDNEGDGR